MVRKYYTKKLGSKVASDARPGTVIRYHVISGEAQKWSVVSEGSTKAMKAFVTQQQAVNYAKLNASKKTGEVIIHGKTGQIQDIVSYAVK